MKHTKDRELTPQELKRKKDFEEVEKTLVREGYTPHNLTVSILSANLLGLLTALPFVILLAVTFVLYSDHSIWEYSIWTYFLWLALFLAGIVVHEMIHGLTWGIFAKNHFKAISFGVIWKQLTPYCTCSDALTKFQYIIGSLMPTIVLGGVVGVIAVATSSVLLVLFAGNMIICGCGDLLITLKILCHRTNKKEVLYYDHPYEVGLVVFER